MYRWETTQAIASAKVVGIIRQNDSATATQIGCALMDAGMRAIEVALTTPGGLQAIQALADRADGQTQIGAGTVLDDATVAAASRAGASFVVSPVLSREVISAAHRYGLVAIPGVSTATEAFDGMVAGADIIKLFPGAAADPATLAAIRAALPQIPFMPTGGVSLDDAGEWLAAGAVAVGIGNDLTRGDLEEVGGRVTRILAQLAEPLGN